MCLILPCRWPRGRPGPAPEAGSATPVRATAAATWAASPAPMPSMARAIRSRRLTPSGRREIERLAERHVELGARRRDVAAPVARCGGCRGTAAGTTGAPELHGEPGDAGADLADVAAPAGALGEDADDAALVEQRLADGQGGPARGAVHRDLPGPGHEEADRGVEELLLDEHVGAARQGAVQHRPVDDAGVVRGDDHRAGGRDVLGAVHHGVPPHVVEHPAHPPGPRRAPAVDVLRAHPLPAGRARRRRRSSARPGRRRGRRPGRPGRCPRRRRPRCPRW